MRLYCSPQTAAVLSHVFGAWEVTPKQSSEEARNGKVSLTEEPTRKETGVEAQFLGEKKRGTDGVLKRRKAGRFIRVPARTGHMEKFPLLWKLDQALWSQSTMAGGCWGCG